MKYATMTAMDVHQLRVFVSVYKNRSFSKASEQLYLTQPTISDHIKTLEEELECRLFDRLGRTIIPTKEADVLYNHALTILERVSALKETFSRLKKEISGELVVGASTIPGTYLMPRLIAGFKEKHPSVSFTVVITDSKDIIDKVMKHELLVGVVGAKQNDGHLAFHPLLDDDLVVIAAPSLIKGNTLRLEELVTFPMLFREEGSGTRKEVERILEQKGIDREQLRIAGIFGSTDAVKQAVKEGLGITIISRFAVTDELKHRTLKEIKVPDIQMNRKFYIVSHKKRTLPLPYALFLEHIKAHL
ncbi:MAG: selenium metabolism-associated LysR family transcriptional regulator [Nitrospirota bacterium]